jgi:anti-sigma regulatory factor (Ser/Thr protein kinase)
MGFEGVRYTRHMSQARAIDVAFPALPESSPQVRRALRTYLEHLGLDASRAEDAVLATGEAVGNAIEHAYRGAQGTIRLRARVRGRRLYIEVLDRGHWRLDGDPERGRGLSIMRALVDRVSIESSRSGTSVSLELAF